jgi:hypothetical protein
MMIIAEMKYSTGPSRGPEQHGHCAPRCIPSYGILKFG